MLAHPPSSNSLLDSMAHRARAAQLLDEDSSCDEWPHVITISDSDVPPSTLFEIDLDEQPASQSETDTEDEIIRELAIGFLDEEAAVDSAADVSLDETGEDSDGNLAGFVTDTIEFESDSARPILGKRRIQIEPDNSKRRKVEELFPLADFSYYEK